MIPKNYIFIDESGKPEVYSTKGVNLIESGVATKYLVLAAVRSENQLELQQQITQFKSDLLRNPNYNSIFSAVYTLDSFHAQTDFPQIRREFYKFINELNVKIDVLVVEKMKCYPSLRQNPGKLYGVMAGQLLKNIAHQSENTEIIFSRKDSKLKLRNELEIEVERVRLDYIQKHPNLSSRFELNYYHNPHYSHGGLQVADYVAYSVFRLYEYNDKSWFDLVKNKIGKIHDICNKKYFTRSNAPELSN